MIVRHIITKDMLCYSLIDIHKSVMFLSEEVVSVYASYVYEINPYLQQLEKIGVGPLTIKNEKRKNWKEDLRGSKM